MAILSKGTTYADGTQVTATNLNALVDSATFASGAVDDSTTQLSSGAVIVKDLGIATGKIAASAVTTAKIADSNVTTAKIADSNVTTAKIADSNVTKAKIENLSDYKVLGNVSGGAAAPAEVAILDEDNMASNSATSLATQQSIKAYADSKVDGTGAGSFTTLAASGDVTFDTTTLKVDSSNNRVGIGTASPSRILDINDDAATGVGIRVTGGGGGGPLAQFVRDVSSSGSIGINIAGGDPQLKLTSSGSDVMTIGLDGSENTFQVCAGGAVGSNQVLVVGTNGKVGIGETTPSAPLTVTSTTGGVLLPRMTTSNRTTISSPSNGEMVYDTDLNKFYGYANGAWVALH